MHTHTITQTHPLPHNSSLLARDNREFGANACARPAADKHLGYFGGRENSPREEREKTSRAELQTVDSDCGFWKHRNYMKYTQV